MKKYKQNKGITLIAVVITIIVMLILVSVTITVAVNGGLFGYARNAKVDTEAKIAEEQELAEIGKGYTTDELIARFTGGEVKDEWFELTLTVDDYLEADTNGIYHIKNCADLVIFRNMVNNYGYDFVGETVVLDNNLNLDGSESKQWEPIGIEDYELPFLGTFDGKNHYIDGLYYSDDSNSGLFGFVSGEAVIKNVIIKSNSKIYGSHAGGIVGSVSGNENKVKIINCKNSAAIGFEEGASLGGIVGYGDNVIIENCYNLGSVKCFGGTGSGGIIGYASNSTVKSCCNSGSIKTYDDYSGQCCAGGIAAFNERGNVKIENCYNTGSVEGHLLGGIIGKLDSNGYIKNCYNVGVVEGEDDVGEIAGSSGSDVINCYYKSGTNHDAVGENLGISLSATAKTDSEMKTDAFVSLLNNNTILWKKDTNNKNQGYPILSWQ